MLRVAHPLRPLLVLLAVFTSAGGGSLAFATPGSGPAGLPPSIPPNNKAATPAGAPAGAEDTDVQLKRAVNESLTKLGNLDPQQKKIFDEEVVPQYSFFVKDYSQIGNKVSVQVDIDAIKNYLGFSAAKNIPTGTTQLLLYLKVDPHCPKCVEATADVHKMIQARVERRGFVPLWITPEELLENKPTELAEKRNHLLSLQHLLQHQLAVLHPAQAQNAVGKMADLGTSPAHDDHFQAVVMVQVDVHGG